MSSNAGNQRRGYHVRCIDLLEPVRSCRIRRLDKALTDPPDIAMRTLDAPWTAAVGHVADLHLQHATGRKRLFHGLVSVLDVDVAGRWHGCVLTTSLACHDGGCADANLHIGNATVGAQAAK